MKRYKIIHLDDHKLVTDSIRHFISSSLKDVYYLSFNDTNQAFRYLVNSVERDETIDMFITDYAHPGLDGYQFARAIRQLEQLMDRNPMKILLLTMYSDTLPIIKRGLGEEVFNWYLSLNSNPGALIESVKSGLGKH